MDRETLSPSTFELARKKAFSDPDLIEVILWIETLTSVGVSPTAACTTWATHRGRQPLSRLDAAS